MAQDLTEGKPFTTILTFSLPIIGGNLFQLFYTLADSIIVGQTLGADALAAVGATSTVVYLALCFIQGVTGGFGICLGHRFGQKDEAGMRKSIATSTILCLLFAVVITAVCCCLSHPILYWINTPKEIYSMAYSYMFTVLLGTGATVFYNLIANLLRALGDSRTPLVALVFSSVLNILLDLVFIVPLKMGVAGAAWATVLSQLLSAIFCLYAGAKKYLVLRLRKADFQLSGATVQSHLKTALPMGLQMSVMCIGQMAMQGAVNALGAAAIAGYTAATKVDQFSVLVNNAMGISISNYVAQNYGAGLMKRIRSGVSACLLQTSAANVAMCAIILLCRNFVTPLFVNQPTAEIALYANQYFWAVAPFYLLLGFLMVYRSAVQSMGNTLAPFLACVIQLIVRVGVTIIFSHQIGYIGICFASPISWFLAGLFLIPFYRKGIKKNALTVSFR